MTPLEYAETLLELLVLLAVSPFLLSVIVKTKAWFGGRQGPPWLQPYYDLYKLLHKEAVYSTATTWLFRAGPVVNLAALLTAATLLPVLSERSLMGFSGDMILFAYLLALGRMFTVLAALDTGSSFEGMGASREVTFGAMAEPAMFLAFVALSVTSQSMQLGDMFGSSSAGLWHTGSPAIVLIAGALFVVLLTETCRVPVDDPATHLELTMVHEVMVLDHSGPEFACITYGASLKFALFGSMLVHVAVPHPDFLHLADAPLRLVELVALAVVVGAVESVMARLRLNRVPLLLAGSNVLAALAVVLVLGRNLS